VDGAPGPAGPPGPAGGLDAFVAGYDLFNTNAPAVRLPSLASYLLTAVVTIENTSSTGTGGTCQFAPSRADGSMLTPFGFTQITVPGTNGGPVYRNVTLLSGLTITEDAQLDVTATCTFSMEGATATVHSATITALKVSALNPAP
jgi:hypothetical protein